MARARIPHKARAKLMTCFEIAVMLVTLIWLGLVVFAGVSFVVGLIAVYWVGVLGLGVVVTLGGAGRRLLNRRRATSLKS